MQQLVHSCDCLVQQSLFRSSVRLSHHETSSTEYHSSTVNIPPAPQPESETLRHFHCRSNLPDLAFPHQQLFDQQLFDQPQVCLQIPDSRTLTLQSAHLKTHSSKQIVKIPQRRKSAIITSDIATDKTAARMPCLKLHVCTGPATTTRFRMLITGPRRAECHNFVTPMSCDRL